MVISDVTSRTPKRMVRWSETLLLTLTATMPIPGLCRAEWDLPTFSEGFAVLLSGIVGTREKEGVLAKTTATRATIPDV